MAKFKAISAVAATTILLGSLAFGQEINSCRDVDVKTLGRDLPFIMKGMKIVQKKALTDDVCSIIAGIPYSPNSSAMRYIPIFYIKDKGVIVGTRFDGKVSVSNIEITQIRQKAMEKAFNEVKNELKEVSIAEYKPKEANGKVVYAFVDPLCPFCTQAEKHIKEISDKTGYTFKIIPFIVHGQPAYSRAENFICNRFGFDKWVKHEFGEKKECKWAKEVLSKAREIEQKLGLSGTPTFITGDGRMVVGANIQSLKNMLNRQK